MKGNIKNLMPPILVIGWSAKALGVFASLFSIKYQLSMLGEQVYAIYVVALSLAPWLALCHCGFPQLIQNEIARHTSNFSAGEGLESTLLKISFYSLVPLLALSILGSSLVTAVIFDRLTIAEFIGITVLVYGLLIQGISAIPNQILYALHRPLLPNVLPGLQPALMLCLLTLADSMSMRGLFVVSLCYYIPIATALTLRMLALKSRFNGRLDLNHLKRSFKPASRFATQLFYAAAITSIDYIILSQLVSSSEIVDYDIVMKFGAALLVFWSVCLANSWTPIAELCAAGKTNRLRGMLFRLLLLSWIMLGGLIVLIESFGDNIFLMLTNRSPQPETSVLLLSFYLYLAIKMWSDVFALALNASDNAEILLNYLPWQLVISVGAQVALVMNYGSLGVLLGMTLAYTVTCAWYLPWKCHIKFNCQP